MLASPVYSVQIGDDASGDVLIMDGAEVQQYYECVDRWL